MKITLNKVKEDGNFTCNISHLNRMCSKINQTPSRVYDIIKEYGGEDDTITRETIFSYITDKYNNGDYDKIYKSWLRQS